MSPKIGKAISTKYGYSVNELFVIGEDGKYIVCGYGVCNPEGELIQSFPTQEAAENYLEDVVTPPISRIKPK